MENNRHLVCQIYEGTRYTVERELNELIRHQQLTPELIHSIQYQMVASDQARIHGWHSALIWYYRLIQE